MKWANIIDTRLEITDTGDKMFGSNAGNRPTGIIRRTQNHLHGWPVDDLHSAHDNIEPVQVNREEQEQEEAASPIQDFPAS